MAPCQPDHPLLRVRREGPSWRASGYASRLRYHAVLTWQSGRRSPPVRRSGRHSAAAAGALRVPSADPGEKSPRRRPARRRGFPARLAERDDLLRAALPEITQHGGPNLNAPPTRNSGYLRRKSEPSGLAPGRRSSMTISGLLTSSRQFFNAAGSKHVPRPI